MSDLATVTAFQQSKAQLPVDWYFDERIAAIERKVLFDSGPGYVGHELMLPNVGDFHSLDWNGDSQVLVRTQHGIELLSNICRHRQATILKGRGSTRSIVCPLHRWTYGLDGKLLGAPHFPSNPCLDLARTPLYSWNGMLFKGPRNPQIDLGRLGCRAELDFSGYVFDRAEITRYAFNWKTFIEVYLEDYHVDPFHPGLGHFVNCDELAWELGDNYSVQIVGVSDGLNQPGSPVYRRWHEQVLSYHSGKAPKHGAIWMVYYPNVMVEWYPQVLVISTLVPEGPEACANVVEYYFPEEIGHFERAYVDAERDAYRETALEDEIICMRMTEGRRALYLAGTSQIGPYQSPMEDGMQHFHEWLRRNIESEL